MENILVIGSSSWIAKAFIKQCIREGHNAVGIHHQEESPITADVVVNFACPATHTAKNNDILRACSSHIFNWLGYADYHNAQFIQISSTAAKEIDLINPSVYSIAKRFAEMAVTESGGKVVRLRHIYGKGMTLFDGRVHSNMIGFAKNRNSITYWGTGQSVRTFTHISDVVSGILAVMEKGKGGEIYEVSNPEGEVTIKNFAETIARISNLSVWATEDCQVTKTLTPDIKNTLELGWTPRISLIEGLKETLL